jgi:hypothetical protein
MDFVARTSLEDGLARTIAWFEQNRNAITERHFAAVT